MTLLPSVMTSSNLTEPWVLRRPRMYCATCGTSSMISRRVLSLDAIEPSVPSRTRRPTPPERTGRPAGDRLEDRCGDRFRSGPAGDDDRPIVARSDRPKVVAARDGLDLEAGGLGEPAQLVGRHEPQPIPTNPANWGRARCPLLVDRREFDGAARRIVLGRRGLRHEVASLRIRPDILEDEPTVEPGEVVRVRQPDVGDGETAGREMTGHRPKRAELRGSFAYEEQGIQADEREFVRRFSATRLEREQVGLDELKAFDDRRALVPRPASRPFEHRRIDVDCRHPMSSNGEWHRQAARARTELEDRPAGSACE